MLAREPLFCEVKWPLEVWTPQARLAVFVKPLVLQLILSG